MFTNKKKKRSQKISSFSYVTGSFNYYDFDRFIPKLSKPKNLNTGIMQAEIKNKLDEIAEVLIKANSQDISLMGGGSGLALFFYYYSIFTNKDKYGDKAFEIISNIFDNINEGNLTYTFSNGLAGFGWLIELLEQNNLLEVDTDETIGGLDEALYPIMLNEMKNGNYDYLHNAGGVALYFLKRKPNPTLATYLAQFVDLLEENAEFENDTVKWKSDILRGNKHTGTVYNISMSHGISSLIVLLSKINNLDINKAKTEKLLRASINFLLSAQFDVSKELSYFPNIVSLDGEKGNHSRLAWCYGDLGIASALWSASKSLNNKNLEKESIKILLHASKRRELSTNMVHDAGLCHGTAGIAHIFNRMYINTKIEDFRQTSDYWFNETLKMARFEDGLAGYKAWHPDLPEKWTNELELLEGVAGIGLAIISRLSETDLHWDECLLLS